MGKTRLDIIFNELKDIRTYLVKIGSDRRKGEILEKKINEAKVVYKPVHEIISQINEQIKKSELKESIVIQIKETIKAIHTLYKDILGFGSMNSSDLATMAPSTFDLKVAVSLLPVMDNTEGKTEQLIDAIELYDSMLDADRKTLLINFVLKTRLSSSAKLRMLRSYADIKSLITDMKIHLLTRKSATALQSKLTGARQGSKSIEDFGRELEEIFVNLTISQANDDDNAYTILKPINEKNAIKRFADGLNNQKLSTIIASRNFTSLKEAIRAAQDEYVPGNDNSQIMTMSRRGRCNRRDFTRNYMNVDNRQYNPNRNYRPNLNRGRQNYRFFRNSNFNRGRLYTNGNTNRPNFNNNENRNLNSNRGHFNTLRRQNNRSNNSIHDTEIDRSNQQSSSDNVNNCDDQLNQFFRASGD